MNQSLYTIANNIREVLHMGEELPEDALKDTLEALTMEFDDKVDAVLAYRQQLIHESGAYDDEIKRMTERKRSMETQAEKLKSYVVDMMTTTGKDKHKGLFSVTIGKPSHQVVINDLESLPDDYFVIKRDASKSKIKQAIEQGLTVPGASIEAGKPRILIK